MGEETRHSKALDANIISNPEELARIDLGAMKQLLAAMLAKQLHAIYEESASGGE